MYLWVLTACVLGEGVEERDAFVVGWSFLLGTYKLELCFFFVFIFGFSSFV